jgi:proteasome lid subunit RPN8/RPN11
MEREPAMTVEREPSMTEGARVFQASEPRALTITTAVDHAIRAHGQGTYPHECCGALVGKGDHVTDVVALPNTTEEGPRRRFLVRPSDYRDAERRARELGAELLGFYHSHPDHPARPSQYDLDHAWPTFAYIIVAVGGDPAAAEAATAGDMTVWFLKDDRSSFEEGSLHHGENSHPDTAQAVHR